MGTCAGNTLGFLCWLYYHGNACFSYLEFRDRLVTEFWDKNFFAGNIMKLIRKKQADSACLFLKTDYPIFINDSFIDI